METEELWRRAKAYKTLITALRACSSDTKKEVVEELNKQEGEGSITI